MTTIRSLARRFATAAAAALLLTACDVTEPSERADVAQVHITPAAPTLVVGETLRLAAVARDAQGDPLPDRDVTWASLDADIATVTGGGLVTALAEGEAVIVATSEGVSSQVTLTVGPVPAASLRIDVDEVALEEGQARQMAVQVLGPAGEVLQGRNVIWTSEDDAVASVGETGRLLAFKEGEVRIIATHGLVSDTLRVRVRPIVVADLLYDIEPGTSVGPHLIRADLLTGEASALFEPGGAWQAVASPAGSRIAFACNAEPTESPSICTARRDGSDLQVLTDGDAQMEDEPAWSPDGTRILFRRWAPGGPPGQSNQTDIWIMNADGTGQVNLTDDALVQGSPAWSPALGDGSYRIVFTQEAIVDGFVTSRLYTMRPDGSARQPITAGGLVEETSPAWAPNGATIVFVRNGGEYHGELIAIDVASGEERLFLGAPLGGEQRDPAWSPDGRFLAFTSLHEASPNGNFRRQVYTVRGTGADLRRRTTSDVDKRGIAWLPRP